MCVNIWNGSKVEEV